MELDVCGSQNIGNVGVVADKINMIVLIDGRMISEGGNHEQEALHKACT